MQHGKGGFACVPWPAAGNQNCFSPFLKAWIRRIMGGGDSDTSLSALDQFSPS